MLSFSTKAATLKTLTDHVRSARIAPVLSFTVADWQADSAGIVRSVQEKFADQKLIVRSSCKNEDAATHSNAGAYLSLMNVVLTELTETIQQVIASYGKPQPEDEVLIQPMLKQVIRSGVAFSHDPNTCAPYRIVNWTEGEDTASVTGGQGGRTWQAAALSPLKPPDYLAPIVNLIKELLVLFGNIPIDCEFAVTLEDAQEILWLLQARPLIMGEMHETQDQQAHKLKIVEDKITRGMRQHPFLKGQRTVYGVMPDWNPAEIIGIRPKPLSLSLYRDLVTDSIWAYQRHNYGYRNLRGHPLMPHFFGLPYIDVRLSFNSFIPDDLDDGLAGRLVDHYIDRLLAEPTLHDKVEFDIVFSCYTLDLPRRLERLESAGFTIAEQKVIADSLRNLTNRIIHPKDGLWRIDAAKLDTLNDRRERLLASDADPLERIYWLLEDARRYGTLPFAGLARAGFVAVQMLRSLVSVGVLSENDYEAFMVSVSTVSGQLARDRSMLDQSTFLARYGHLRPGTYDILSLRYDEAPELYFDWEVKPPVPPPAKPFSLTLPQMREISRLMGAHDLNPDVVGLFDFLQAGIELRELSKFHFTRNLSDALSLAGEYGEQQGFSRDDMAYCDLNSLKELHVAAAEPRYVLSRAIEQGKARYRDSVAMALPPLIIKPEDVWAFEWPETAPNFITQKTVTAPVVKSVKREELTGTIVCIPNADPGFDWLFSYPIAGLITTWGGANSHMAIRAGEMGLPAVIGAGEVLYRCWAAADRLCLDCAGRRVEVLS
jgi:glutamine kinase